MPVDRSLLPPLPGKPEWYVEGGAPRAVEGELLEAAPVAPFLTVGPSPVVPEPSVRPEPVVEVVTIHAEPHGRRRGRVRALAGLLCS